MKTFTVHQPPHAPRDRLELAEVLVFIADGFSFQAALLAPIWMLGNGMWLVLAGYAAIATTLAALVALGVPGGVIGLCLLGLHVAIGYEAASLRRWSLERQGWQSLGAVTGESELQCERRFFDSWLTVARSGAPDSSSPSGLARNW